MESFAAKAVGSDTSVFFRSTEGGVEGFVVDHPALVTTLKQRVLDERGLSEIVDVTPFSARAQTVSVPGEASKIFRHEFAEPFSSVQASLRLARLEESIAEQLLAPLAVALGMAIVVGLYFLYRAVSMQFELAERQSNFVSAVTHELKTPLTAIRMHSEMLADGLVGTEEKRQESFRTIKGQAERLSRLIGNVLFLSNVERGQSLPISGHVLVPLLKKSVEALNPHVRKNDFSLQLDAPDEVPSVHVDPDSLEQILFNLVDNSLKYAKEAKDRRIAISVEVDADHVDLIVRDRGAGVPEVELVKIFDAFYRREQELTRRNQGTGLGLSLVASLASQMNANVRAENAHPGLKVVVRFGRDR